MANKTYLLTYLKKKRKNTSETVGSRDIRVMFSSKKKRSKKKNNDEVIEVLE